MENEFEYYFIRSSFKNGNVPLLCGDDKVNGSGSAFLFYNQKMAPDYISHLCLGSPIPSNPDLTVDALSLEGICCVFSRKIYDVVNPFRFKGLQFVPTIIRGKDNEEFDNFYIANIYNQRLESFDPEKTAFKGIYSYTKSWKGITKIVLDRERLSKIPQEERLVFVAKEHCSFILYHKTIVEAMKFANPNNLIFTRVEDWYEGIQFRER